MEIHPFRALHYSPKTIGERGLDRLVAPPYDRITPEIREQLYAAAPENIVRFDFRRDDGGDIYAESARQLKTWMASGVMEKDAGPALWIHAVEFRGRDGKMKIRRSLLAMVRLEDYAGGSIRPHERTLAKAKEDRLSLLNASHADFGLVFLITRAPIELDLARHNTPDLTCHDLAGNRHDAWRVTDAGQVVRFQAALAGTESLIADGHHRYETALKFSQMPEGRKLPGASRKLCAIVDAGSPGLEAFAIPRAVSGLANFSPREALYLANDFFEETEFQSVEEGRAALEALARDKAGFLVISSEPPALLTLRDRPAAIPWPADKGAAWRRLDVSALEVAFFQRVLNIGPEQIARGERVSFPKDENAAIEAVENGKAQMAVLLRPTPISAVEAVVREGEVLPQKSTLFEPKMISGMVGVCLEDAVG